MPTKKEWLQARIAQIKTLYPELLAVYGPYYSGKDGRSRVVLRMRNKKFVTKQYAKIKMELLSNRRLGKDDTVSHEDRNKNNDAVSNLKIRPRKEHLRLDAKRLRPVRGVCRQCETEFTLSREQRSPRAKKKAGPFCSKKCSGAYGAAVQNGAKRIGRSSVPDKKYAFLSKEKWDEKQQRT